MALTGDGGLDAQVEQRMDAYRGNPQQLQKRYGKNKELLDLLALQKLTTEKKQIAAAMQLEQEQQPGTIAEQREAEAIGLVKQEMGGTLGELQARTGDTLGQQAKMQKKGMNKMAEGAGKSPQAGGIAGLMGGGGRPPQARPPMPPPGGPQAAGLPNARMMQAAQGGPVRRMAGGGIVGFAGGEGVRGQAGIDREKELQKRGNGAGSQVQKLIADLGIDVDTFIAMPVEQRKKILDSINDKASMGRSGANIYTLPAGIDDTFIYNPVALFKNMGTAFAESRVGTALGFSNPTDDPKTREEYDVNQKDMIRDQLSFNTGPASGIQTGLGTSSDLTTEGLKSLLPPGVEAFGGPDVPFSGSTTTPPTTPPETQETELQPTTEVVEEPAFIPSDGSNAPQIDAADKPDLVGGQDPMAQMQLGFDAANKETGRADKAAEYDSMLAEMKAFDAENYDPERERNDRLKTFLMGAAGTTNVGTTFAQAGAASMNLGNKQRVDRRSRLQDKFNMQKSKMATDTALAQTSVQLGKELYSQATQDNRAAMQAGVQMRGQDLTRLAQNAQLKLDTMKNEDTNAWKKLSADHEKNKLDAKIIADQNTDKNQRIAAANATVARTLVARETFAAQAALTMNLEGLRLAIESAEFSQLSPEEIQAAQLAYDTAAAKALVLGESMMNSFGRGGTAANPTGSSLLDAEQRAIQVLAELQDISEDDVKSVTTTGN